MKYRVKNKYKKFYFDVDLRQKKLTYKNVKILLNLIGFSIFFPYEKEILTRLCYSFIQLNSREAAPFVYSSSLV